VSVILDWLVRYGCPPEIAFGCLLLATVAILVLGVAIIYKALGLTQPGGLLAKEMNYEADGDGECPNCANTPHEGSCRRRRTAGEEANHGNR
jgi:hypothetical protein